MLAAARENHSMVSIPYIVTAAAAAATDNIASKNDDTDAATARAAVGAPSIASRCQRYIK